MDRTQVAPLLAHIAHSIIAPRLKRRLFGPPYLPLVTYLLVYQEAFEIGVVLGYAYRDRMLVFARLLCSSGSESGFVGSMQDLASKRITGRPNARTFIDLGMAYEDERIRCNWRASGVKESEIAAFGRSFEMPAGVAWDNIGVALHAGIGFGSRFSDQAEKLWKSEHEYPLTMEQWNAAKARGVIRPDEVMQKDVTLAEKQAELVARVEAFASDHHPELLAQLRFTG